LRIEAQRERIAIVVPARALGLPCREGPKRLHLGDSSRRRFTRARARNADRRSGELGAFRAVVNEPPPGSVKK
jgi:hypothetical protein